MARRFAAFPDAIAATEDIAAACTFDLGELAYQYPHERVLDGLTAHEALVRLTDEAARRMFSGDVPQAHRDQIGHELRLIEKLGYAPYFLTVNAIVAESRRRGILCQGRGSAANSCVCFVLGITSIDPIRHELLFERFVSGERKEPPDIDVDFEHERREEIIQWIYETYGRDRSALTAVVQRYRARGAVRDVGKALGLPEDLTKALSGLVWGWSVEGVGEQHLDQLNLNKADRRLRLTLELARKLIGTPRHMSQHPGGFVLTHERLDNLVPIEPARMKDRQIIEWDKDDIDALKFMKVDVLGLGMLGCMNRAFNLLEDAKGIHIGMADLQDDDPDVYAMIQKADTLGTFQIESRAQMSMLPRMKPARFYDLTIEVAIVRPGPIQGDMVHPYLRRREGLERPEYPKPELRAVLEKTLGVPLFQEQAMKVAIVGAGFTPAEADQLRRAMATFKITGGVSHFYDKLVEGMVARGYPRDFAERTFKQIEGFGSYGFPESHAASVRQDRLCVVLDEASSSRRLLRVAAQCAADGLLRTGAGRRRRPQSRGGGPPGLHQCESVGLYARAGAGPLSSGAPRPSTGERPGERPRRHNCRGTRDCAVRVGRGSLAAIGRAAQRDRTAGGSRCLPPARRGSPAGLVEGARPGRGTAAAVRGGR